MNNEKVFMFGKKIDGYDVPVLNEREVRASAGILFFFALISFMNSWLIGEFLYTKIFVVMFLFDFIIRVLINPEFSPSLIVSRFIVSGQNPEYVGAPQKRFAWSIGLVLAVVMTYLLVVNDVKGPLNLLVCGTCLLLLFFESAFGICIACKIYNFIFKRKAQYCAGGVCKTEQSFFKSLTLVQILTVVIFMIFIFFSSNIIINYSFELEQDKDMRLESNSNECVAPDWAIKMGHEDKWKLHHGCK